MLLLEVAGKTQNAALLEVFTLNEPFQLVPYAVLGDFTLRVQLEGKCPERGAQIRGSLEGLGLQVLGYRWTS